MIKWLKFGKEQKMNQAEITTMAWSGILCSQAEGTPDSEHTTEVFLTMVKNIRIYSYY